MCCIIFLDLDPIESHYSKSLIGLPLTSHLGSFSPPVKPTRFSGIWIRMPSFTVLLASFSPPVLHYKWSLSTNEYMSKNTLHVQRAGCVVVRVELKQMLMVMEYQSGVMNGSTASPTSFRGNILIFNTHPHPAAEILGPWISSDAFQHPSWLSF